MVRQLFDMCYRTIHLKTGSIVPCNRCAACIARRVSTWSFRLQQEEKISSSAHFITLTYDTRYVPILPSGYLTLLKNHVQLFFKRLRKSQCGNGISPIKYYTVGEYGGQTQRPHYHAIIFNAELELIEPAWQLGSIYKGDVNGASIGYCLKYMMKHKKSGPGRVPGDPRQREFALMSKGLGISYLNDEMAAWHAEDLVNRVFCSVPGGIKIAMPRYYKEKLYFEHEKAAIRDAYAIISHDKQLNKILNQTAGEFINEQKAIDASFDRMYFKAQKTML